MLNYYWRSDKMYNFANHVIMYTLNITPNI